MQWTAAHVVAIAESASALLAGGALLVSARLLRREAKRDRAREETEKQAQAAKVSAWMRVEAQSVQTSWGEASLERVIGYVQNGSDLPVYDAVVMFATEDPKGGPPTVANQNVGFVAPQGQASFDAQELQDRALSSEPLPLIFRDSGGRRWFRDGKGILYASSHEVMNRVRWWPYGVVERPTSTGRQWVQRIKRALHWGGTAE